jgi:hypothetical protein
MCHKHWLCETGKNGGCYFEVGNLGVGGGGSDLSDELWDQLDEMHDHLRASGRDRGAANKLGVRITFALREATRSSTALGSQRRQQLEARYAGEPDAQTLRLPLRVVIRAEHDAATAAAEIRKLGEAFATGLAEQLRK